MIIGILIIHLALNLLGGILNSISAGAVSGVGAAITSITVSIELLILAFEIRFYVKIFLATRKLDPSSTPDVYQRRAPPPSAADLPSSQTSDLGQTSMTLSIISERTESPAPMFDERDVTEVDPVLQGIRRRTTHRWNSEDSSSPHILRKDTEARIGL